MTLYQTTKTLSLKEINLTIGNTILKFFICLLSLNKNISIASQISVLLEDSFVGMRNVGIIYNTFRIILKIDL